MGAPGCDDAPIVHVEQDSCSQRDVTLIYPYYENPHMLARQSAHWSNLPDSFRTNVSVIVVDDGSPKFPAEYAVDWTSLRRAMFNNVRLYRIDVDVRWNWLAARNVGAHHCRDGWMLITDMDHVILTDTVRTVVRGKLDRHTIYRFTRVGAKRHPHPNSWLYTREMYWKVGGYDEALSGFYGTDGEYRRRCAATAPIRIIDAPLECCEHDGDASTTTYLRKQPQDAEGKRRIKARGPHWRPKVLSFPYHEVKLP